MPNVPGHRGELVLGELSGVQVAVWRGRPHFYEGWSMAELTFPLQLLKRLGGEAVVLTNAAGGLNPAFQSGDLMVIDDHIFLPGLAGHNPLRGQELAIAGERFVSLTNAYNARLRGLAHEVADRSGISLRSGVYVMVAGPNYETAAEGRLLRAYGADAVGMSTVPETIVARQLGLRVLGLSAITNLVLTPAPGGATHAEVLAASEGLKPRFVKLLRGILAGIPEVLNS
jgi:purine-nucleoside phosphorylase